MSLTDMNKWLNGESEIFFDPHKKPLCVDTVSNPGADRSIFMRKFAHLTIAALIGAFASIVLVSLLITMRPSVAPSPAASPISQPSYGSVTLERVMVAGGIGSKPAAPVAPEILSNPAIAIPTQPTTTLSDEQAAASKDMDFGYDHRTETIPTRLPGRKPSSSQWISRRHWSQPSSPAEADSGEATRLMLDELQQMGIAAGATSGSEYRK
jgi:hypothetical protein